MSITTTNEEKPKVYLESDPQIRGQEYVCLSIVNPDKALLRNKNIYFISKFLEFYAMDYKIRATQSFVLDQFREMQAALSDVELILANTDVSGSVLTTQQMSEKVTKLRETVAKKSAADMEAHIKANLSSFRESDILEAYNRYMLTNRQRLEDDFHKENNFQTSMTAVKIGGAYPTDDQARARAKELHKLNPYFNVYVAPVGVWLPLDFNPEDIPDQVDENEQLHKLLTAYKDNASKAAAFFEEEKRQRMTDAAAAASAARAKKGETNGDAVFGVAGSTTAAATVGREIFDGIEGDLAIARKMAASGGGSGDTISYA